MSLTSEIEILGSILKMQVSGSFRTSEELYRFMRQLKMEADAAGCKHAIFNLLNADGRTTDLDRYFLGQQASSIFGARLNVAVVFPASGITKFGENVAVNRGAKLIVVPTEEEALKWFGPEASTN